tara:strand:+ start:309 stop:1391 length:1083 start_codon:yes stop_codon:yes gene_type:complete
VKIFNILKVLIKFKGTIFFKNPIYTFYFISFNQNLTNKRYDLLKKNYKNYIKYLISSYNKYLIDEIFKKNKDYNKLNLFFNQNYSKFTSFELELLYFYFRFFDSILTSFILRKKINIKNIKKYENTEKIEIKNLLTSALYEQRIDIILKLINKNKSHKLLSIYDDILNQKIDNLHHNKKVDKNFLRYNQFISSKNIVIIGPLSEINHTNFNDYIKISSGIKKIKINNSLIKPDIYYLNSNKINKEINFLKEIISKSWIICKNNNDYQKIKSLSIKNSRISRNTSALFQNGSPLMLINILLDLNFLNLNNVYLDGFDFYANNIKIKETYKNYDNDSHSFSREIRKHDIFENYSIFRFFSNI